MLQIFKISGDSLYPFFKNGQRVLCRKIFTNTPVNINDTVLFKKENYGMMIKRVTHIENHRYFVEGTDPYSIDSKVFGTLTQKELLYKVLCKF